MVSALSEVCFFCLHDVLDALAGCVAIDAFLLDDAGLQREFAHGQKVTQNRSRQQVKTCGDPGHNPTRNSPIGRVLGFPAGKTGRAAGRREQRLTMGKNGRDAGDAFL